MSRPDHIPAGWIYFIQMGRGGPIKIGYSWWPKSRISELQTGAPFKLTLLGNVEGDMALERQIHRELARHRLRGEWFRPHADVLAAVRAYGATHDRASERPYTDRGERCSNCGVPLVDLDREAALCNACEEFRDDREGGRDPFAEAA